MGGKKEKTTNSYTPPLPPKRRRRHSRRQSSSTSSSSSSESSDGEERERIIRLEKRISKLQAQIVKTNYGATLKELLLKPKGEIHYISPTIQNEIISLLGTTVRNNIISEIKKAPFLTIILDTTQDLTKIDQLSVVFRYISVTENDDNVNKEIKICESFLGFIAVTDCSAAGLKTVILNLTKEYGIDLTKCRGQGYDGANVMSGVCGGLQTALKEHAPNVDYVHCVAHALNLVLNDAARHVREVSTFFDNLEKIYTFFGNSIKRWAMLSDDSSEKCLITLKKVCPTRWSSSNDALLAVKKNL
nr:unnamed protein product [Callosobruchus analis]